MDKRPAKSANSTKKVESTKPTKPVRKSRRIFLWLFLLLLLGIGTAAGSVYMGWIPIDPELAAKYKIPLRYPPESAETAATAPQTNFPLVELEGDKEKKKDAQQTGPSPSTVPVLTSVANAAPAAKAPERKEELERAKTLGKLARLYGAMKADEAVAVMNNLDDDQVLAIFSKMEEEQVSKILAALEPRRAARLTQIMLKKKN